MDHVVTVHSPGAWADGVDIGVGAPGQLHVVAGGELATATSGQTSEVGTNYSGELVVQGGTMSVFRLAVGSGAPGAVEISGGSLSTQTNSAVPFSVGASSYSGELRLVGSGWSLSTGQSQGSVAAELGADATVIIAPSANGPGGLSPLQVLPGTTSIAAGSTLELDVSSYEPKAGDSWTVIDSDGGITGSFGTLSTPEGYEIEQDLSEPGLLGILVTVPEPGFATSAAAALLTLFALRRRRCAG